MDKNWTLAFKSPDMNLVSYFQGILETNEVTTIVVNKQSSAYPVLNQSFEIELYVQKENVLRAIHLINKNSDE